MDCRYLLYITVCLSLLVVLDSRSSRKQRKETSTKPSSAALRSKMKPKKSFSMCTDIRGSFGFMQHCCLSRRNKKATLVSNITTAANNSIPRETMNQSHNTYQDVDGNGSAVIAASQYDSKSVVCLPSFVIAGTQKSATTVLSALLSEHPHISFAPKKEIHFFDRNRAYKRGKKGYLSYFEPWEVPNASTISRIEIDNSVTMPVYGEATPFYVASRYGCKRMSEMIPNLKIIVMMREPISRAYSEYQMKKRRVESQNSFIELVRYHQDDLHSCLINHRLNFDDLAKCLPVAITEHSHYPKLKASLQEHEKNSNGGFAGVMAACFNRFPEGSSDLISSNIVASMNNDVRSNEGDEKRVEFELNYDPWPVELNDMTIHDYEKMLNSYLESSSEANNFRSLQNLRAKSDYIFTGSEAGQLLLHTSKNGLNSSSYKSFIAPNDYILSSARKSVGYFQADSCLTKYARETVSTVTSAMQEEMEQIESCGTYVLHRLRCSDSYGFKRISSQYNQWTQGQSVCRPHVSPSDIIISEVMNMSSSSIYSEQKVFFDDMKKTETNLKFLWQNYISPVEAEVIVRKCVNITSGISKQFIYRSMYAPQISQCMRHFPREQFLFLPSEKLHRDPEQFLRTVLRFIGFNKEADLYIPNYVQGINGTDINTLVARKFPRFEEATGWKLKGKYPKIPNTIVHRLKSFFKPLNEALLSLISKDFIDEWYK